MTRSPAEASTSDREDAPGLRALRLLPALGARAAGVLYGWGARLARTLGARGRRVRGRPSCAIVSVGGLTVGGAGKTPTAAAVAMLLAKSGLRVVLASRGYRGATRDPVNVVSDGRHVRAQVARTGDESLVLAAHAPGVPVLVGRDRRIVGHRAVSGFGAEVLVLDDGFQHHGLDRDFDLVCVDGDAGFGNGRVVPAGPLREPLSALRWADAALIVGGGGGGEGDGDEGEKDDDRAALRGTMREELPEGAPIYAGERVPVALAPLGGGAAISPSTLAGTEVGLIAGIARPSSLRRSLEALGARVVAERRFPDHHAYVASDLTGLRREGGTEADLHWITTEKDAYKILPGWVPGVRVSVLRMELRLEEPDALCERILAALRASGRLGSKEPYASGARSTPGGPAAASAGSAAAVEASGKSDIGGPGTRRRRG